MFLEWVMFSSLKSSKLAVSLCCRYVKRKRQERRRGVVRAAMMDDDATARHGEMRWLLSISSDLGPRRSNASSPHVHVPYRSQSMIASFPPTRLGPTGLFLCRGNSHDRSCKQMKRFRKCQPKPLEWRTLLTDLHTNWPWTLQKSSSRIQRSQKCKLEPS